MKHQIEIATHSTGVVANVNPDNIFLESDGQDGYFIFIGSKGFKAELIDKRVTLMARFCDWQVKDDEFKILIHVAADENPNTSVITAANCGMVSVSDSGVVASVESSLIKTGQKWRPNAGVRTLTV